MSQINDSRAAYWDKTYRKYWEERVAEGKTNQGKSKVQQGDARTEGDWVYERIFADHPFKSGSILDVGCAWGRMFPIYHQYNLQVSGIDISEAMIQAACANYAEINNIDQLKVATAENLPFADNSHDNIVCVAVFDATYQHQALAEFLRVLKPSGHLYLTGKSDNYPIDDDLAYAAEQGARSKGHPNYFTDVPAMREALHAVGCNEIASYTFTRRGDFADFSYSADFKPPFYEWCLVIKAPEAVITPTFSELSSKYSKSFYARQAEATQL